MWRRDKRPLPSRDRLQQHSSLQRTPEARALDFPDGVTSLGPSMIVKGELTAREHIIIEGQFEGQIVVPEHGLAIGMHANVKADVVAKTVAILGVVTGNLRAGDRVEISDTATVQGHIVSTHVTMADGAQFKGTVNTQRAPAVVAFAPDPVQQKGTSTP